MVLKSASHPQQIWATLATGLHCLCVRSPCACLVLEVVPALRRYQAQFTYKQVFNGLSVTLTGSDAQQAQAVAALKALPQVVPQLTSRSCPQVATCCVSHGIQGMLLPG